MKVEISQSGQKAMCKCTSDFSGLPQKRKRFLSMCLYREVNCFCDEAHAKGRRLKWTPRALKWICGNRDEQKWHLPRNRVMTGPMASKHEIKLAENLKRLMAAKNLTVSALARQIGMNKSTLHNYCNGVIPRNLQMLRELADLLDVPLAELLYGKGAGLVSLSAEVGIEGRYEITIRRVDDWGKNGKR